ncbi:MAG: Serine/threonine-protein kinase pkn1 [Anaerolineales bacterium]|nr:Serine/threonine-protein kinase pkn1 [Anaerolineales bacterium]
MKKNFLLFLAVIKTFILLTACSTSEIKQSTKIGSDGAVLVFVQAGKFTMGNEFGENDDRELPVHTINLPSFWIDQTEVTNGMYEKCVADGACEEPQKISSPTHASYYGNPEFKNYPVIYVNWEMAKTYCEYAGRRLPTEAEWEKSARGTDARVYPWGNEDPNKNLANYHLSNIEDATAVGTYPNGASVYGAYDMAGNVYEWVSSLYKPYPYNSEDGRENLSVSGNRVIRSGSWTMKANFFHDPISSTYRSWLDQTYTNSDLGFRCALSE